MAKHGKKYKAALAKVDPNKHYSSREAIALAKETSITKFDATVEVHLRTALDPRQADQQVRDVVVLPNGLGKTVKVLVFAQGEGGAQGPHRFCRRPQGQTDHGTAAPHQPESRR